MDRVFIPVFGLSLSSPMDMETLLFGVFWLLPGFVLGLVVGISGTLLVQRLTRFCNTEEVKKNLQVKKYKTDEEVVPNHKSRRHDEVEGVYFLSSTKRVHKTRTCSNMQRSEEVQLCLKCFKLE